MRQAAVEVERTLDGAVASAAAFWDWENCDGEKSGWLMAWCLASPWWDWDGSGGNNGESAREQSNYIGGPAGESQGAGNESLLPAISTSADRRGPLAAQLLLVVVPLLALFGSTLTDLEGTLTAN